MTSLTLSKEDEEFDLIDFSDEDQASLDNMKVGNFTRDKLHSMISACNLAYNYRTKSKTKANLGYKTDTDYIESGYQINAIEVEDSRVLIMHNSKTHDIIIAFRGTVTGKNAASDANMAFTHSPYTQSGLVHSGFLDAFEKVKAPIKQHLELLTEIYNVPLASMNVNVTGHSLGGAMATICGSYLTNQMGLRTNVAVATFGSPRVYNTEAAAEYELALGSKTARVNQHRFDPVPAVPAGSLSYKHVGEQLRIDFTSSDKRHSLDSYMAGFNRTLNYVPINTPSALCGVAEKLGKVFGHVAKLFAGKRNCGISR